MDPVILIVVPGLIGGVAIALLIAALRTRSRQRTPDVRRELFSTDVINMARIRVAGVGGLGLIAMAGFVAWFVPRIGQTLLVGLVLGVVFAAVMILRRRRIGPIPSSGRRPGANTILSIDQPALPENDEDRRERGGNMRGVEPAPQAL
jgi:MFS superfamily sulfate permease-like transporter